MIIPLIAIVLFSIGLDAILGCGLFKPAVLCTLLAILDRLAEINQK